MCNNTHTPPHPSSYNVNVFMLFFKQYLQLNTKLDCWFPLFSPRIENVTFELRYHTQNIFITDAPENVSKDYTLMMYSLFMRDKYSIKGQTNHII